MGSRGDGTSVLIVGAGPAGLVLGNLLRAQEIDCVIVERQSRQHVEQRARAGFLAANSVRILDEHGLAGGLHKHGQQHDTCAFRTEDGQFELKYSGLGRGEIHTVYPQQDLVRDLIAEFLDRGGEVRFETVVDGVHDVDTDRPWISAMGEKLFGRFIAGCDGQYGVARSVVPGTVLEREHGVSWLAILAEAPPSMAAVTYAIHDNGFAGHMARTPSVTRYYLQCPRGDDPDGWSDERIWLELDTRMRVEEHGSLVRGRILERRVVDMRSYVMDRLRHGRLFLVGDAASLISPSAAKGANLAIMAAELLAGALVAELRHGDHRPLARYSAECLPRIWRAQEFSHWMINLLHGPPDAGPEGGFLRALRRARLESLRASRAHQDYFAENYVGV